MVSIECQFCGISFEIVPSRLGKAKYCSRVCYTKGQPTWNKGKKTGLAPWRGKKRPELVKTGASKTMFKKGLTPWNKGMHWSDEIKEKLSLSHIGLNTGPKNFNWKGCILSEVRKLRNSRKYQIWRKAVFERDDYTCQICLIRGGELNADHIKKFSDFLELRFSVDNGMTLCKPCHLKKTAQENTVSWVNQYTLREGVVSNV